MREIDYDEARSRHGITPRHQEMPNGEFRFRLLKSDGTAYIRTEASETGAWQSSHYHNTVKETYIVQEGWISYAELINGERRVSLCRAGEQFTTQPGRIHNVYMPANAVIHTVKHGDAATEDRIVDETTKRFDTETQRLTEEEVMAEAAKDDVGSPGAAAGDKYGADYRHFDTLIWQLPAWCTAIFLVTAVGTNSIIQQAKFLTIATKLTTIQLVTGFLVLMCLVIMALSQALFRFRRHQAALKRLTTPVWSSASTYLQLIVTAEALTLFLVVLLINGVPLGPASWLCIILLLMLTVYRECRLRQAHSIDDEAI